jgi:alkylhydroperoxidase family enzyme
MSRIEGVSRSRALVARLAFFLSRRSYGRVITPARVYALDSRLLLAVGLMEEMQEWAKQTSAPVKHLARMLVAWRIGWCWCLDFGTSTSQKLGVTDEQLRALPYYEHSCLFSEEARAGEPCPRSGSRGGGRPPLPSIGRGATSSERF